MPLIDQINNFFEKNCFRLSVFIIFSVFILSKASVPVDHNISIKKLKLYSAKENNLRCVESYLNNRKQYITYNSNNNSNNNLQQAHSMKV